MNELFSLMEMASRLKELYRTGWIEHKISGPLETTAAHTFGVMLLAWWFSEKETINKEKVIKMALVHDLLESITRDFTPTSINQKERDKIEQRSLKTMERYLPHELKKEVTHLIQEYRNGKTEEAKMVKVCDRLDTLFQEYFYVKTNRSDKSAFEDFFSYTEEVCKAGVAKEVLILLNNAANELFPHTASDSQKG